MSHSVEKVAILDAGSQYGKVIDRRVRESNVEAHLLPLSTTAKTLISEGYQGIIISGGPQSVYESNAPLVDPEIFDIGVPVLGICYGMQLMSFQSGKQVGKKTSREDGQFIIEVDTSSLLFKNLEKFQQVLLTHGDTVFDAPEGWNITSRSGSLIASIENPKKKLYGVQFHPEVDLTINGVFMLRNFLFGICGLHGSYTIESRELKAIDYINSRVGPHQKVLVLVSGGVDSSVCAALCTKALGPDRVHALHISNGFMRKEESQRVETALQKLNLKLQMIDASETFYAATTKIHHFDGSIMITERLDKTVNPEDKRKIIGDTFMRVAQAEIDRLGLNPKDTFLAQGTLRPDLIESASHTVSSNAEVIKTHHNDTALVRELRSMGHVIEPLADYHKDEVRVLGRALGLPESLVSRHPFPGPGLAIRIICSPGRVQLDEDFHQTNAKLEYLMTKFDPDSNTHVPPELVELREEERKVFRKILKTNHVSAHLLPLKTVGVQGDGRSYKYICALSCDLEKHVQNQEKTLNMDQKEGNTETITNESHVIAPDWEEMFGLAKFLPKIYHNINRVVYVFGKRIKDAPVSLTPTYLTRDVIEQLQEADEIVNQSFQKHNCMSSVSQAPVISFPCSFEMPVGYRSIAIRTLITNDFMTGSAAVPGADIDEDAILEAVNRVSQLPGIARVVYDLTSKPPATTEWE